MTEREPTGAEIREMSKKEVRKQFPSGWMELARYETLVLALDALLEAPATREFTVTELAEQAGTTPKSLRNRIDSLVELSVVETVNRDGETRYTLNDESPVVDQLYELNVTVQRVRESGDERVDDTSESELPSNEASVNTSGDDTSDDQTDRGEPGFKISGVRT